ncbi:Dihydrolipoyllysine-residue succinyltransferase component of 2-oxoglutarate dehydrogenase complex [Symmachiella macrocystis]|uniref:Dihydrolipoyllysine-residue succinyltransferase component of 2-oxoglutarate dehydrogenase complex n=1 Tax=Symmachiella macrocystis TaxID=2527985 RepID=A0A5C6BIA5_9PLAN|nr:2-oxoglutarate dehydrogenase complex dihydrolipoyllysine-residue succinyltransferase [Symmachiella macrocystis]TWU11427.1 Dihydrolipoyllysine-residue succinyltransferase component of 2-oxoglutarate dehydrogenase complex [Symmachiella macrocystis]
MSIDIKVPTVGESINEVFIGEWHVAEGDWIEMDQPLVGLETDKATFDVPAPQSGIITKITKEAGEEAAIGEIIGQLEPVENPGGSEPAATAAAARKTKSETASTGEQIVMPAAARMMAETGIAASDVTATGPGGRLLKEDVQRAADTPQSSPQTPATAASENGRLEKTVPMSPIRRRIAERLVEAQQNAALLTTFNEIDMSAVKDARARYKDAFIKKHDVKLGFMSFFVKAAVAALNEFPQVNAQVRGKEMVYYNYYDIGIAVGGGKGLIVPVLRNAERLSFAEVEKNINDFGRRAQENKIGIEELQGGTFTITNGGVYGSLLSTPIVNPPQSGVLGMHGIIDRPIAVNGEVVIRPMMYVALTYDHRIVDGREAVSFLKRIKEVIEDPARLVLEV